jgi:tRNA(Ile)-lysidine synthase
LGKSLQQTGFLPTGAPLHLLVAYSGGVDSTVLLHLAAALAKSSPSSSGKTSLPKIMVTAAYYDHGWRRPLGELPTLHQNCQQLGVPLVIVQPNDKLVRVEAAGRQARYEALTRFAADIGATVLLTAHQADDQVETLLFRICRGTGLEGLQGIQAHLELDVPTSGAKQGQKVPVVRPLLDFSRQSLVAYAKKQQLAYFEDPTNNDTVHLRNVVRHQLLPKLEAVFPMVRGSLLRLADNVAADWPSVAVQADEAFTQVVEDNTTIDLPGFRQLSDGLQRRVIKRFLENHDIESRQGRIDSIQKFLNGEDSHTSPSAWFSLGHNAEGHRRFLALYRSRVHLLTRPEINAELASRSEPVILPQPGSVYVPSLGATFAIVPMTYAEKQTWLTWAKWQDAQDKKALNEKLGNKAANRAPRKVTPPPPKPADLDNPEVAYVSLALYPDKSLTVRTRRSGDSLHMLGMDEPMRLKKFLINRHIPSFLRDTVPLVTCQHIVLWVVGHGVSEHLRFEQLPTHKLLYKAGQVEVLQPSPESLLPPRKGPMDDDDKEDDKDEPKEGSLSTPGETDPDAVTDDADTPSSSLDEARDADEQVPMTNSQNLEPADDGFDLAQNSSATALDGETNEDDPDDNPSIESLLL